MRINIGKLGTYLGLTGTTALLAGGLVGCSHHSATTRIDPMMGTKEAAPTAENEGIAVSLKALAAKAREQAKNGKISGEVRTLEGMTQVVGYLIDKKNQDVVLIGRVKKGAPRLYLDDLCVALRVAFMKYAVERGDGQQNTRVMEYTPPAVSIDPDPAILTELHAIERRTFQTNDVKAIQAGLDEWTCVAKGPQKTRILGLPPCFMAHSALFGDYEMKRIVDGSLLIPGITSLTKLHADSGSRPASSLNRFWIVSVPPPTFVSDNGIVLFKSFPIGLRTEAEVLVNSKKITGSGREDPMAKQFCASFSKHYYDELTKHPYYTEIANGFRWIGVTKLIHSRDAFAQSGMSARDCDFYLTDIVPATLDIPETLPGIANLRPTTNQLNGGTSYQWLMTVGGVDMSVSVPDTNILQDPSVQTIAQAALAARPRVPAFWWRFRANGLVTVAQM